MRLEAHRIKVARRILIVCVILILVKPIVYVWQPIVDAWHVNLGYVYLTRGEIGCSPAPCARRFDSAAAEVLESAIRPDKSYSRARLGLARVYSRQNMFWEAAETLFGANLHEVSIDVNGALIRKIARGALPMYVEMGKTLWADKRFSELEPVLWKIIYLDPHNVLALSRLVELGWKSNPSSTNWCELFRANLSEHCSTYYLTDPNRGNIVSWEGVPEDAINVFHLLELEGYWNTILVHEELEYLPEIHIGENSTASAGKFAWLTSGFKRCYDSYSSGPFYAWLRYNDNGPRSIEVTYASTRQVLPHSSGWQWAKIAHLDTEAACVSVNNIGSEPSAVDALIFTNVVDVMISIPSLKYVQPEAKLPKNSKSETFGQLSSNERWLRGAMER